MNNATDPLKRRAYSLMFIALVSAATLAGAWYFQLVVDLVPCPLCLKGRWHHYTAIPLALAALALLRSNPGLARNLVYLIALVFLAGTVLSVYHAGIEYGFWPGPESCAVGAGSPTDAGGLLNRMSATKVVACDEAAWTLFGISLAGYNALISLALAVLAIKSATAKPAYGSSSISQ